MFKRYFRHDSGATAIMLGLAAVPLFMVVGLAVDYNGAVQHRTTLQAAADAASMAAAASGDKRKKDRKAAGQKAFKANLPGNFSRSRVRIKFTDDAVIAEASAKYKPNLMRMFGVNKMKIEATSEVGLAGLGPTEIVFVLDYSSSMKGQYKQMRNAAVDLIKGVTENQTNKDVKIGIAPFARQVFVTLPGEFVLGGTSGVPWTNCTITRRYPHNTNDSAPKIGDDDTKWGRTDGDDTIDADEYKDCPNYPAHGLVTRRLTNDHAGTVAQLKLMTPYSGTNLAAGVAMGHNLISPNLPFADGDEYDGETQKFVIILSDGRHNKKDFGPGKSYTTSHGHKNIQTNCAAMKANGVKIVAIAYDIDDAEGKSAMRSCASEASFYFEGDKFSIDDVFGKIGKLIASNTMYYRK